MADTMNGVTFYTDETGRRQAIPTVLISQIAEAVAAAQTQGAGVPMGYQQIGNTALAAATSLAPPVGATTAFIQNNGTQGVRWRDDGGDPTETIGQRIASNGGTLTYAGNVAAVRVIRETDGAQLDILYYG